MPKKSGPKLYKVTRKIINEDKNNLVIRFKNIDNKQLKQLRADLNEFISDYFTVVPDDRSEVW